MNVTKTVLYVEDSHYNVLLVKAILGARSDILMVAAPTGNDGLIVAQHQRVDLLLLDLNLPDMRGEAFLQRFRATPGCESVPVIIISGESVPERLQQVAQLSVSDVLMKPFDIDHFENMIDQCLAK